MRKAKKDLEYKSFLLKVEERGALIKQQTANGDILAGAMFTRIPQ